MLGRAITTPSAVMEAIMLIYEDIGDLLTIDVRGALTKLPEMREELERIIQERKPLYLLPSDVEILIDKDYIIASIEVTPKRYPKAALKIMKSSLKK